MPRRRRNPRLARTALWAAAALLAAVGLAVIFTDWVGDWPWWVGVALVSPLAILVLHFLSTSEPTTGAGESGFGGGGGGG